MAPSPLRALVDLIYPPRCVACRATGALLCAACLAIVHSPAEPLCPRCGRGLPVAVPLSPCPACAQGHVLVTLTSLRAATTYDDAIHLAVLARKYRGQRRLTEPLRDLQAAAAPSLFPAPVDLVIPVPLHAARRRRRGDNQLELLARRCAARLALPCEPKMLRRHRATPPQVGLCGSDRRANVAGAFAQTPPSRAAHLAGKRVLLVDDVSITSSTLDAAAAALLLAGPAADCGLAVTRPDMADDMRDTPDVAPLRHSQRRSRQQ